MKTSNFLRKRRAMCLLVLGLLAMAVFLFVTRGMNPLFRDAIGPARGELPATLEGFWDPERSRTQGEFVGHRKSNITERFGPPTHQCSGHYGAPPLAFQWKYVEAFTLVYERPTGTLYLSFCWERGDWVCFSSSWVPPGWVF
jgi:hypothetical protein